MADDRYPQVGVPDPELKTSPIAEELDEDVDALREEMPGEPVCFFNDKGYENGAVVSSGNSILRCQYGVWIRVTETV